MSARTVALFSALCLVLLAVPVLQAQGMQLRYAMTPGKAFALKMKSWADIPFVKEDQPVRGEVTVNVEARFDVAAASGGMARLESDLAWNGSPNVPTDSSSASFDLDEIGVVSNLQSPDLNDPQKGPLLKGVAFFFPRLPAQAVNVGSTWSWPVTLTTPAGKVDGGRPEVSMDVQFKLSAVKNLDGRRVAVLDATAKEKPGQTYKVDMKGQLFFDLTGGYLYKSALAGTIKKRVLLMTVTVPVKIWLDPM